jgi:hypothetical protein
MEPRTLTIGSLLDGRGGVVSAVWVGEVHVSDAE